LFLFWGGRVLGVEFRALGILSIHHWAIYPQSLKTPKVLKYGYARSALQIVKYYMTKYSTFVQWLLIHKKDWSIDICYHMDGPWKHHAKWKKPDTKVPCRMILFIWNVQSRQIHRDRKQIGGF
jgi:hypothetical protein